MPTADDIYTTRFDFDAAVVYAWREKRSALGVLGIAFPEEAEDLWLLQDMAFQLQFGVTRDQFLLTGQLPAGATKQPRAQP